MHRLNRSGSYGRGIHEIALDESEIYLDPIEVEERMLNRFRQQGYQPPVLPAVAIKLMEFARQPNAETNEIVALLEQDPMLAAHILKVANSAAYGNSNRIRSIRDAVVRLGRVTMMNCVMEVAVAAKIFRVKGYEDVMSNLSAHSRATGHIAKIVSNYTWVQDDFVFLCGLLHDVGLAGILIALGDVPRGQQVPEFDLAMVQTVDSIHAEVSAILCELWGLPDEIALVIRKHHELLVDSHPHPIASVVCLAEHLANSNQVAWADPSMGSFDQSPEATIRKAREILRLDDKKWQLIVRETQEFLAKT